MKKMLLIGLLTILGQQVVFAQASPEGPVMIDEKTIIKDESGKVIDFARFDELMKTGEWAIDPVMDSKGKLEYLKLRKATEEDKKMMAQMSGNNPDRARLDQKVPDYKITDLNGKTLSLESTKGKVVFLNFWFTACKPCVAELPDLNKVYERFKSDTNVVFAAVTFDEKEKVEAFLKSHSIDFAVCPNSDDVCKLFGIQSFPTNIVIDKTGKYQFFQMGSNPMIEKQLSEAIQNALEGRSNLPEMKSGVIQLSPDAVYKLENGKKIDFDEVLNLLNTKNYEIVSQTDKKGNEFQLLKKISR